MRLFHLLCAAGFATMAVARADDPAAKAAADPISTTRRELEVLKTERPGLSTSKPVLPSANDLSMPSLTPAPLPVLPKKQTDEMPGQQRKSSGWLVDAMEKSARTNRDARGVSRGRGAASAATDDAEDASSGQGALGPQVGGRRVGRESTAGSRADLASEVRNPLDAFMAGWMTERDFKLTQESADANSSLGLPGLPAAGGATAFEAGFGGISRDSSSRPADEMGSGRSPTAKENPYLQSLAGPAPAAIALPETNVRPANLPTPTARPATVVNEPTPAPRNPPSGPATLKRSDDAKYFPQLKRF